MSSLPTSDTYAHMDKVHAIEEEVTVVELKKETKADKQNVM